MTTLYWILEYAKVLFAYGFIMFIWPSVIFRKYLRGKGMAFRVAFCATAQVVIVNSVVLTLGLLHILNPWVVRVLFYGSFLYSVLKEKPLGPEYLRRARSLMTGTYGIKSLLLDIRIKIVRLCKWCWNRFAIAMQGNWLEYGLLFIVIVYGMIYFSYGAFQDYSYGFGDMYPHNAWIYGLVNGEIFTAGIYPEGMHCFVYAQHILFGIRIYSCLLFTAGIHIAVFLLSAYILLREVFKCRFTPIFALTLFLTVDVLCIDEVYSMSRLQWTLPQEFALYTQFICVAFLVKYLRSNKRVPKPQIKKRLLALKERLAAWKIKRREPKKDVVKIPAEQRVQMPEVYVEEAEPELTNGYWDENLLVFMLSMAASLVIHFYPLIMAFFLCVAFIILSLGKVFNKKRFLPLVTAAFCGVMIAIIPMVGAMASGIGFQGSIGWALSVMGIELESEEVEEELELREEGESREEARSVTRESDGGFWTDVFAPEVVKAAEHRPEDSYDYIILTLQVQEEPAALDKVKAIGTKLFGGMIDKVQKVYRASYVTLYKPERAALIIGCTIASFAVWLIFRIFAGIYRRVTGMEEVDVQYFDGYFCLTFASVLFMFLYGSYSIGLPELIAGSRVCSVSQLLILAMALVPVDMFLRALMSIMDREMMCAIGIFGVFGIYLGVILTGNFHGYLYYEFTRFNGAVMTTHMITETLPKETYTIVSPVDELYPMIQYSYHEELTTFINKSTTDDYTIPTEYVFLFLEKKPLEYAQSHFFTGPSWLAQEKYADYYISYVSQCPDITTMEISAEMASLQRKDFPETSKVYSNLAMRTILESNLYEWCQEFEKIYPGELHTYYEDEYFVCYYFKQNVYSLYQLGLR